MRTQDDLRSALSSLERLAPDPQELLTAVTAGKPRRRARWPRPAVGRGSRLAWLAGISALITAGAVAAAVIVTGGGSQPGQARSEEHTSELQSRI